MDRKTLLALVDAGAIRRVRVIGEGSYFRAEVETQQGPHLVKTVTGKLKTWTTLDAAAKWFRALGIGTVQLDLENWHPAQRAIKV